MLANNNSNNNSNNNNNVQFIHTLPPTMTYRATKHKTVIANTLLSPPLLPIPKNEGPGHSSSDILFYLIRHRHPRGHSRDI